MARSDYDDKHLCEHINREIESLIEGNQIEEAIANCRHILERYPKHVATYRLLGKAYLEVQRYTDAEDVLQRVLSCIPDDFIAHLGLSIIREEAGDLETAIWHMERAFDVQPSNAAIQAELRRLYGRRDGTPPVKVTLTRGALARMSARSHLYSQVISELRHPGGRPQRPDLQVVLARLYFQTGQRNASVEICSSLLNRLPELPEANRILPRCCHPPNALPSPYYKQRVAIDPGTTPISPRITPP
jgi:tetratricopeptide (TPR) repeat protein